MTFEEESVTKMVGAPSSGGFISGEHYSLAAKTKTANWIRMPVGVVSGVGRGMGVLDGSTCRKGKWRFWEDFRSNWFEWRIFK